MLLIVAVISGESEALAVEPHGFASALASPAPPALFPTDSDQSSELCQVKVPVAVIGLAAEPTPSVTVPVRMPLLFAVMATQLKVNELERGRFFRTVPTSGIGLAEELGRRVDRVVVDEQARMLQAHDLAADDLPFHAGGGGTQPIGVMSEAGGQPVHQFHRVAQRATTQPRTAQLDHHDDGLALEPTSSAALGGSFSNELSPPLVQFRTHVRLVHRPVTRSGRSLK